MTSVSVVLNCGDTNKKIINEYVVNSNQRPSGYILHGIFQLFEVRELNKPYGDSNYFPYEII